MRAHRTILTHFSQRYPTLPPTLNDADLSSAVVASDFMRIPFPQLIWAPKLLPALKILLDDSITSSAHDGDTDPANQLAPR